MRVTLTEMGETEAGASWGGEEAQELWSGPGALTCHETQETEHVQFQGKSEGQAETIYVDIVSCRRFLITSTKE